MIIRGGYSWELSEARKTILLEYSLKKKDKESNGGPGIFS